MLPIEAYSINVEMYMCIHMFYILLIIASFSYVEDKFHYSESLILGESLIRFAFAKNIELSLNIVIIKYNEECFIKNFNYICVHKQKILLIPILGKNGVTVP